MLSVGHGRSFLEASPGGKSGRIQCIHGQELLESYSKEGKKRGQRPFNCRASSVNSKKTFKIKAACLTELCEEPDIPGLTSPRHDVIAIMRFWEKPLWLPASSLFYGRGQESSLSPGARRPRSGVVSSKWM